MKIEELRCKMCIPSDAGKDYIENVFKEIADFFRE